MRNPFKRTVFTLLPTIFLLSQTTLINAAPTWVGTTSNMLTTTNWTPTNVPIAGDTAIFQGTGSNPSLTTGNLTTDTFQFTTTPHAYTFAINGASILSLGTAVAGTGVDNSVLGSPATQIFNITNGGQIRLVQSGSGDVNNTGTITYNVGNVADAAGAKLLLYNSSTTGKANINLSASASFPALLEYNNNSSPGNSAISAQASSQITFQTTNTTSTATVALNTASQVNVLQSITLSKLTSVDAASTVILTANPPATLRVGDSTTGNTFNGIIQETGVGTGGVLIKQGSGDYTLTNSSNSYNGGTTVAAGTLRATTSSLPEGTAATSANVNGVGSVLEFNDTSAGNFTGAIFLNGGGLSYTGSANSTLSGAITGTGDLTVNATGSIAIPNTSNAYNGATTVTAGTLIASTQSLPSTGSKTIAATGTLQFNDTAAGNFTGAITDNGTITYTGSANSTLSGAITGTGGLTVNGTGSIAIPNTSNSYGGATTVTAGTLIASTQSLPTTGSKTIAAAGTLEFNDTVSGNFTGAITDNGTITYTGTANSTLSGAITGSGDLIKNGSGNLTLTSTGNTYSAGTFINTGTLISDINTLPGTNAVISTTIASGATLQFAGTSSGQIYSGDIANSGTIDYTLVNPSQIDGDITGTGQLNVNAGFLTLAGTNTYSGGTHVTNGATLNVVITSLPVAAVQPSVTLAGNGTTLQFNDSLAQDYSGDISTSNNSIVTYTGSAFTPGITLSGAITGTASLVLNAGNPNAILTLSGANTYSGGTTITQGTLAVSTDSLPLASVQPSVTIATNGRLEFSLPGVSAYSGDILNNAFVTVSNGVTATLSGQISGTGALGVLRLSDLTLTGTNTYGGTTAVAGTLHTTAANLPVGTTIQTINALPGDSSLVDFTTTAANEIFTGPISGPGVVQMSGTGHLTLTGNNTYTGGTHVVGGILTGNTTSIPVATLQPSITVSNATFEFNQTSAGTYSGDISLTTPTATLASSGPAALSIPSVISGSGQLNVTTGQLTLSGANTYTGGSSISAGATLIGDTTSLQGAFTDNGTLTFNQLSNGIFNGTVIGGTGVIQKNGAGTLIINSLNNSFAGTTNVNAGVLNLNGQLGGNVNVIAAAITGIGKVGGNLSLQGNSVISPGNSIGTLTVDGDYVQTASDTYVVEINGTGQSDLISVAGNSTLAGNVQIISLDGVINPANDYWIFHSDGTVTGTFANVTTGDPFLVGELSYITNFNGTNVFLSIDSIFNLIPETSNQAQIGYQLASITNPTPEEALILTELALLASSPDTIDQARLAYDQMSGEQYTNSIDAAEISSHQFLRRLYDPLRSIVNNYRCECDTCCEDPCPTFDVWLEGGGGRTVFKKTSEVHGFNVDTYEITGGVQSTFKRDWTIGLAGSYVYDKAHYNVGGHGKNTTGFAGLYGLYRANDWYVLADAAFGYTENKVHRVINIGTLNYTADSKPKIYQALGYVELGKDLPTEYLLIQPFAGIEVGYFKRNRITETGTSPLNLLVSGKQHTNVFSRLGLHLTSRQLCNTSLSFDIAWQYRMTKFNNTIQEQFQSFGTPFTIKGQNFNRNSVDGALTIATDIGNNWQVYVEATGEVWSRAYTYNFLGGVKFSW